MPTPADDLRVAHLVPALFDSDEGVLGGAKRYALEPARYMAAEVPTELVTFGERSRVERVGDLTGPVLFVVGAEDEGVPRELLDLCDETVRIPMEGFIRSYNLQVAVAVLGVERLRQLGG